MELTVKERGCELPLRIRRYADEKAAKIGRFFRDVRRIELAVGEERGRYVAELTVEGDGTVLRGEERHDDLRAAVRRAIEKAERQAIRFKARRRDERRKSDTEEPVEAGALEEVGEEEFTPVVRRRKQYAMKPMSVEEAARQMELVGHSFYLFRNEETGEISAIYKRHDGDYGLIEPE